MERERRWLRAIFGSALVAAAAPSIVLAGCGGHGSSSQAAGAGGASSTASGASSGPAGNSGGGGQGSGGTERDGGGGDAAHDGSMADGDASCTTAPIVTQTDAAVPDSGPDADYLCDVVLPCGFPDGVGTVGCDVVLEAPDGAVIGSVYGCVLVGSSCAPDAAQLVGPVDLSCPCDAFLPNAGRRPFGGRRQHPVRASSTLGACLAKMAVEEAASVDAFGILAQDLTRLGAPAELVDAARASGRDEVRHAKTMARLAARHGATTPRARRTHAPRRARALADVALENAVEGCVRETFAALVAHRQALRAEDPELRRAFAVIAVDETRHAALAWAVARWADEELDDRARKRVARARRSALRSLRREIAAAPPAPLARDAGFPLPDEARALLTVLESALVEPRRAARSRGVARGQ